MEKKNLLYGIAKRFKSWRGFLLLQTNLTEAENYNSISSAPVPCLDPLLLLSWLVMKELFVFLISLDSPKSSEAETGQKWRN